MPGWGPDGKQEVEPKETSVKKVEAEETTKVAQEGKPEVTKMAPHTTITPGTDIVYLTAGSASDFEEGNAGTITAEITSPPSSPKATGTGMVTSKLATSVALDSESGNTTSGNKASGNGTAPETGAASQTKVVYTFMGAMAVLVAVAI